MNILLDPNVIYFLFIGGLVLAIIAIFTPGTGIAELGAFFAIAIAVYGFANLPVNSWAIVIMVLGFIPFIFAGKKHIRKWIIPITFVVVLVASLFIFRRDDAAKQANLLLIAFLDVVSLSLLWFYIIKGVEAIQKKPDFDLDNLLGVQTKAITDIHMEGTVHVNGEDWTAKSSTPVEMGNMVKIVGRSGLFLLVEPVEE